MGGTADILKMIETVSSDDTAKLDEIDKAVFYYCGCSFASIQKYTRSRDALKAIRPNGSSLSLCIGIDGRTKYQYWHATKDNPNPYPYEASDLPTEELAELHAIIQAIEYERNRDL
jgi:hypothetical protein